MTTAMNKAPAGGLVSVVNGQRYEGGEFMPITGLFCGKGRNRVTQAEFESVSCLADCCGYYLRYSDKWNRFELLKNGNVYFHAASLATLRKVLEAV